MNDMKNPPKTIEEIGIHLFYMGQYIKTLDETVKENSKNYALKSTTDDHERRIKKLETKNIIKDTLLWVGLVCSAIINIVLVYNTFSGGQ